MTDWQILALVLILLYLSECLWWIRRGSVVFHVSALGRKRRTMLRHPSRSVGNEHGGFVFLSPLPPWANANCAGGAFECHQWPLTLTPQGACSFVAQAMNPGIWPQQAARSTEVIIEFGAIGRIQAVDRQLLVDGQPFAQLPDELVTAHYARLLERLRLAPPDQRGQILEAALAQATDWAAIRQILERYRQESRPLRWWCWAVWSLLLAAVLVLLLYPSLRAQWPEFLAALGVAMAGVGVSFHTAHKRLLPEAVQARWKAVAILILTPTAAARACHTLSRQLLGLYHPLAVAAVLCGPDAFADFAGHVLRDLAHPLMPARPPSDASDASDTSDAIREEMEDDFRRRLQRSLAMVVRQAGYSPEALMAAPARSDPASRSYCPRCHLQYQVSGGTCADCGGIALQSFQPADGCMPSTLSPPATDGTEPSAQVGGISCFDPRSQGGSSA